jgi:WD40 repeat protein
VSQRDRYDAFVSYSHRQDTILAEALQFELQRFACPWYRPRALRIFRDRTNLAAAPGLWPTIEHALELSDWFVLMASRASAESEWVQKEVGWWVTNRSSHRVLIALTDGEIHWADGDFDWERTDAIPHSLSGVFTDEPLWIDLRKLRPTTVDRVDTSRPRLGDVIAEFAAPIHGRDKDTLVGEHVRRQRRTWRLAAGAITALSILLVVASVAALIAVQNASLADQQRQVAITNAARADEQHDVALSRQLANQSRTLAPTARRISLQLAASALRIAPTAEAHAAVGAKLTGYYSTLTTVGPVYSVAFSPDNRLLATGSVNGRVQLWDVHSGTPRGAPLATDTEPVFDVAFSPDGRLLAAGGGDKVVRLWDTATGKPVGIPLTGHTRKIDALAFSPDGALLATASQDETVRLWNPATGEQVGAPLTGHTDEVVGVAFNPQGSLLASASLDGTIRLWDPSTRRPSRSPLTGHPEGVYGVAFSPDGTMIVSGDGDGKVRFSSLATGRNDGAPLATGVTGALAFSPDGTVLVTAGDDGVRLWNPATRAPLGPPLDATTDYISSVAFSPDGRVLASGTGEFVGDENAVAVVRLWNPVTGKPLDAPLPVGTTSVFAIALSADGRLLASSSGDNAVRLWDPDTGLPIGPPFAGLTDGVLDLAISPDGRLLAASSFDGTVRLWDTADGRQRGAPLPILNGSVALSPDGSLLATGGGDGSVQVWDTATGTPHTPPTIADTVGAVTFGPDGKIFVTVGMGGTRWWDAASGEQIGTAQGGDARAVAFSHDGKLLATGDDRGVATLLDAATRTVRVSWQAPTPVAAIAFSPDGALLATGSGDGTIDADGTIRLWDPTTGAPVGTPLVGHTQTSYAVVFAPDSKRLFSGSGDGTVRQWDTALYREPIDSICKQVGELTDQEWDRYASGEPPRRTC